MNSACPFCLGQRRESGHRKTAASGHKLDTRFPLHIVVLHQLCDLLLQLVRIKLFVLDPPFGVPGLRPPSAPPGGLVKTRQQRKIHPSLGFIWGIPVPEGTGQ